FALMAFLGMKHIVPAEWTGFFPDPGSATSLWALFSIGLLTSVHCLAMCGGIAMTQSLMAVRTSGSVCRTALLYHAGRLFSYSATGAAAGFLGQALALTQLMRGAVMLAAGAFMLIMALNMLGGFSFLRRLQPRLPHFLTRMRDGLSKRARGNAKASLLIGLANGLMPCGPLQSMQIYALGTGSAWAGAFSMACFCLGTMPALLALGITAGKVSAKKAVLVFQCAAVVVMALGFSMLSNGLALTGAFVSTQNAASDNKAVMPGIRAVSKGNGQEVVSQADYGAYDPIVVQKGLPVTWILVMPEGKLIGCNNEIVIPGFGIQKKLEEGNNMITFTPEKSGVFPFSCWMGMIHSSIRVVDKMQSGAGKSSQP
ncbi:MAG: sulfite exporter TauE/SafE family protein, partial [Mailhella sp.]|nr:sulfite exporter TauE/SafE family protein [Mailhella sp.]